MIRIVMLDLGETLVHGQQVFPHVPEALETLQGLETVDGEPLLLSLVSDFLMPTPPPTPAKIEAIFQQYLALLDQFDLRRFFEPVEQHTTLSTHAGVRKPARRIFELAIERLGVQAGLNECLFITEQPEHISACRTLQMTALQFGAPGAPGVDFSDWSDAPLLISQIVNPASAFNTEAALKLQLSAKHGMELISMSKGSSGRKVRGLAHKWHPVPDPKAGGKGEIDVPLAVNVEMSLDDKGRVESVQSGEPEAEAIEDATSFVQTLEDNQQVAHEAGPLPPGATHRIETDKKGRKRLVRKRFTAI